MGDDLDLRVQLLEAGLAGVGLRAVEVLDPVEDLALEVRQLDGVGIEQPEGPDSRRRQVERGR